MTDVNVELKGLTPRLPGRHRRDARRPARPAGHPDERRGWCDAVSDLDLTLDDESDAGLSGSTLLHPGAWHATDDTLG